MKHLFMYLLAIFPVSLVIHIHSFIMGKFHPLFFKDLAQNQGRQDLHLQGIFSCWKSLSQKPKDEFVTIDSELLKWLILI